MVATEPVAELGVAHRLYPPRRVLRPVRAPQVQPHLTDDPLVVGDRAHDVLGPVRRALDERQRHLVREGPRVGVGQVAPHLAVIEERPERPRLVATPGPKREVCIVSFRDVRRGRKLGGPALEPPKRRQAQVRREGGVAFDHRRGESEAPRARGLAGAQRRGRQRREAPVKRRDRDRTQRRAAREALRLERVAGPGFDPAQLAEVVVHRGRLGRGRRRAHGVSFRRVRELGLDPLRGPRSRFGKIDNMAMCDRFCRIEAAGLPDARVLVSLVIYER